MSKVVEEFNLYGKSYRLETGELAKQATGAVLVTQNETTMLVTAVVSKEQKYFDFFPLSVDFVEKMYAAGKIPGAYMKRESKPSEKGTLIARMIDRPIRTGFPEDFKQEVHIVATTLVCDQQNSPDVISIAGASAALMAGGAPFEGPAAGVRIGRNCQTGEFIVNPTYEEIETSDLELTLAGTENFISMVEAGANEISEDDILEAMRFGHEVIKEFCKHQRAFLNKLEIAQISYEPHVPDSSISDIVENYYDRMSNALKDADKASRISKVDKLKEEIISENFNEEQQEEWASDIAAACKELEKRAMRRMIVETGERVDGRTANEIRPLYIVPDYLSRVHGSGLFQRGQTQVLSVCTLGMLNEWQRLDTIEPIGGKRYIHHYNFPPYCTGEVGRMGSPKRRELGHGALAEKALLPVIPDEKEFPYAIRVVSEVLESNGSSSMASTCGSTLALMDAGVPIKRPVSGIAMGLIKEKDDVVILSDIQGLEDFLGDMDFKVCGTERGITALQMDNKAKGLSIDILAKALSQANEGRAFILNAMLNEIPTYRKSVKNCAPAIDSIKIDIEKISAVIGSNGKVIRGIQEESGATIEIEDDGTVLIAAVDGEAGRKAKNMIEAIVHDPKVGEIFEGEVVNIKDFGAFIKLTPSHDGLLHISRIANGHVRSVEDVFEIGDIVKVKVIEIDSRSGKITLDSLEKSDVLDCSEDDSDFESYHDKRKKRSRSHHLK